MERAREEQKPQKAVEQNRTEVYLVDFSMEHLRQVSQRAESARSIVNKATPPMR